ncbi:MAG: metallophosphoesterase [Lachnospiraceae bacterium]|nr:metallophosphoesterase [Lachnospiraceae bacterium]
MDKILFIADLHGNMPATLALEKEISRIQPDDIWFLGDEYPDPPGKEA